MSPATSTEIAGQIEDLYGAPLASLDVHAKEQPPGMLSALLGMHHTLALAERTITVHRERLAQLVHPEGEISAFEVSHVLDCARRLAEAVAVRDTQATSVAAVLQSLGRAVAPQTSPAPATAPAPVPAPVPTASTALSR
ncbi:hypothetical protein [Streptomyces murinus]|uniref:hypothetical protein n=1 Tax=Streptomyces murinus TaxID=33900 RepID=UPI00381AC825